MRTPLQHAMVWGLIVVVGAHLAVVICMLGYFVYLDFAHDRVVVTNKSDREVCVALTGEDDLLKVAPGETGKASFRVTFEAGFDIGACDGARKSYGYYTPSMRQEHTIVIGEDGGIAYDID